MSKFKAGDRLVPTTDKTKKFMPSSKVKIDAALKRVGRPYLVVDHIRGYDNWIIFVEYEMKEQHDRSSGHNAWNPAYWEHYIEPIRLDDDLFEL